MRIFLLPLTTRQALVYCQKAGPKPGVTKSYAERITSKATDTWAKWERAEKGWQKTVVGYGNKALQRIPYQEWGLKSFPPTNPNLQAEQVTDAKRFEVVYPGNVMNQEDVPKVLARLAKERKQLHFKRFWGCLIGMPFTIPFALIPIIPNIPFFYVAYRCWSHWRALRGSDHIDFLLDHRLLKPVSTSSIESIYHKYADSEKTSFDFVTRAEIEQGNVKHEQLLLPTGAHSIVASTLSVPELSGEVERAVWQVDQESQKLAAQDAAKSQEVSAEEKKKDQ